ncbi:hypothetical protein DE4381_02858 [Mycobacterium marinum]|nr:hypothetical protein DE4381_02858 [Mycobacterium marinum]
MVAAREQQRNDRTRPSAVVQEVVGELGAGRIELLVGPGVVLEGEGRGVGVSGDHAGEGGGNRHRRGGGSGEGGVVAPGV